jgi:hypothetical protein
MDVMARGTVVLARDSEKGRIHGFVFRSDRSVLSSGLPEDTVSKEE